MNIDPRGVLAIIPARGGSKSVPKKNIRTFRGHPLIAYTIAAARLSRRIQRVIVSTDSEEIASIARSYGAEVPFLRPVEYARDLSPDIEFVQHAINWLESHDALVPEYLVHLRPTTPIRSPALIDKAIAQIMADCNATSLRSVHVCAHTPQKWFSEAAGQYMGPLFPGMSVEQTNRPRQDFPEALVPNGYVDVIKSSVIISSGQLHGARMIGYRTEEIPDIDTEADFRKLEAFPGQKKALAILQEYLDAVARNLS